MFLNFTDALMASKRKAQLTGRKMTPDEFQGMASGYFASSLDRTNRQRQLDLSERSQSAMEKNYIDQLAEAKAAREAQEDAAGKARTQGYVNTGAGVVGSAASTYLLGKILGPKPTNPQTPSIYPSNSSPENPFAARTDLAPDFSSQGSLTPPTTATNNITLDNIPSNYGPYEPNPQRGNIFSPKGETPPPPEGNLTAAPKYETAGGPGGQPATGQPTTTTTAPAEANPYGGGAGVAGAAAGYIFAAEAARAALGGRGTDYDEKSYSERVHDNPGTAGGLFPLSMWDKDTTGGKLFKETSRLERQAMTPIDVFFGDPEAIQTFMGGYKPNPIPFNPNSTDWRDWHPTRQMGWVEDPNGPLMGADGVRYSKTPSVAGDIPAMTFEEFEKWERRGGFDQRTDTSNMGV